MRSVKRRKLVVLGFSILPLCLYSLTVIGCLYFLIMTSLKSHNEYILNKIGFPEQVTLASYHEAISRIEIISKSHPNATLPHRILGNLYTKTGLKDQAIFELQKLESNI